ncbi:UDP-N-acetylmuramoyl-tripeptide--D-alanyl-D-alanine ligase, partial [Pseudomonas aeruginosa]
MIKLSTVQLAQILQAKLIGDENVQVAEINTDNRKSVSNRLFFALKGEKFDAHQYLDQAVSQGALALV